MNVDPFIEAERAQRRNVASVCQLLKVSRAAYYTCRAASTSAHQQVDKQLTEHIRAAHTAYKGRYGALRIHAQLRRAGHRHGRKRIARLMRTAGLHGRAAPLHAHHDPRLAGCGACGSDPPRFQRERGGSQPEMVRRHHLHLDLGSISTWGGWLYLATVIDSASRRVVGFALAEHLRSQLVADALANAVAARDPAAGAIFHADRGCQYTSRDYATLVGDLEVVLSHGHTGQCWDNALAESFSASLKGECLNEQPWPTRAAARRAVVEYIGWYSGTRLHSALGYLSPDEFESTTNKEGIQQAA